MEITRTKSKFFAAGNLLYNLTELARCELGSIITIQMNCAYAGLRFIPFQPKIRGRNRSCLEKGPDFSPRLPKLLFNMPRNTWQAFIMIEHKH